MPTPSSSHPITRRLVVTLFAVVLLGAVSGAGRAQDEAPVPEPKPDSAALARQGGSPMQVAPESYGNQTAGEMTPGQGFDVYKSDRGSLNISFYGLFRYINQLPADQKFTDHLGNVRDVKTNNMINWHRSMVWLNGFFYEPRLRYTMTIWSLPTTQQTLVFGVLRYTVNRALTFGGGIGPNITARSMQGSWPYWTGSDRQMIEDFSRGGFSSTFFASGEPVSRVNYTVGLTNNLSQLGVTSTNDTRNMGIGASIWVMPSTGEFGPRGGFGDLEHHTRPATRFGVTAAHSRESRYAPDTAPPNATQIRLSDGVFPFETGALIPGVTVQSLDYDEMAVDAGYKYAGFTFQGEYFYRRLSNFSAAVPMSHPDIVDHGFQAQVGHMVVPRHLLMYATAGYLLDDFERKPWEVSVGANYYPYGNRVWRLNLHLIHIEKSPAGSSFGYYTAGQTGTTLSLGTDILL